MDIWLHPLCSQLSISENIERGARFTERDTLFVSGGNFVIVIFGNHFQRDSAHLPPAWPSILLVIGQWEVFIRRCWPIRGLHSAVSCPPCVSKGLWNDLTDYYHQFLAKSRLVFTGPVPTEQSDQSHYKGRIQPWAHKIILNTTPASFSTLG